MDMITSDTSNSISHQISYQVNSNSAYKIYYYVMENKNTIHCFVMCRNIWRHKQTTYQNTRTNRSILDGPNRPYNQLTYSSFGATNSTMHAFTRTYTQPRKMQVHARQRKCKPIHDHTMHRDQAKEGTSPCNMSSRPSCVKSKEAGPRLAREPALGGKILVPPPSACAHAPSF